MKKPWTAAIALLFIALPALAQGPPFVAGLHLPSKIAFTRHGNLVVAEAGTETNNTGRVSLVDRATATRRTLIEGLPSGISHAEEPGSPSGPSGVAVQDRIVYVAIGSGDVVSPGPAPGTEQANETVASPILASLLSFESSVAFDVAHGGFTLAPSDHATLKGGETVTLHNAEGESLTVRLVADFPDYTPEPRPDFPANVRAGNPFGVVAQGQTLYVVDASQNVVRRVDANTGTTTTLSTIGKVANPLPIGAPVIDPVPDSIHLRGDDLVVTTLTGFPFPPGSASVLRIDRNTGNAQTLIGGLTSAIDSAPMGNGANDPLVVLEFSTNMLEGAAGRVRLVTPAGTSTTIAEGLPTPTSLAVDPTTGEIFVTHIFPGFITRLDAKAVLPAASPTAIVPVVASTAGAYGTHFTTTMQLGNPYPFAIAGRFVVHPAGHAASPDDPSTPYSLAPFATATVDSLIASGSGSVDVLAAVGAPVVVTEIVDTTSMNRVSIPAIAPADAITTGMTGTLLTPADASRQRFNIGIRTLADGASLLVVVHDDVEGAIAKFERTLPAGFFQQFSFAELIGEPLAANRVVTFEVLAGSAIVYGASVDNTSGAMSLQIARGVER